MKRLNQAKVADELGISKSYLSMILLGQRKCPIGLMERLQAIPGVHKAVDNQLWDTLCKQEVRGSNPLSSTNFRWDTTVVPASATAWLRSSWSLFNTE
ncbi:helix-turn-helix domain-containing protein [Chloroflexota bacterium]